ncbi:uncharacterized protein LOC121737277 [Aricia agestis]|uniref:uncharacterized protein LOC121737277 n=1 Tax=Aricia agestis TaxID=91739 RepID=UPI001C20AB82|nr:uncharacterized protein LOC121737277 [Aricia agestis]
MSLLSYKYYDTPEGQDIYKKLFVTSKYAVMVGMPLATQDVLMYSHPTGVFSTAYRFAFYLGPLVGMATAFTITANGLQNYRGKNDYVNYFCGGAAAGAVASAWAKSKVALVPLAVVLGGAAMIKKAAIEYNYTFFPEMQTATKTIKSAKHDWSLAKDIEEYKNWTSA